MFLLSIAPSPLQKNNSINLGKSIPTISRLGASKYNPLHCQLTLFFKTKSTCKNHISLQSDKTKVCKHFKQVLHITLSQKHELASPQTFQNTKTQVLVKTGQVLHFDFQITIHSCVLLATSSNTFHTTYLNYPNHPQVTETPFTPFTIFEF